MEHVEKRQWLWMCGKYNMYYIECSFEMIAGEYNKVDATECVWRVGKVHQIKLQQENYLQPC